MEHECSADVRWERTRTGPLNVSVCLAYSAPGNVDPMIAGKSEAMRMPGTMGSGHKTVCMAFESPVSCVKAVTSAWLKARCSVCTSLQHDTLRCCLAEWDGSGRPARGRVCATGVRHTLLARCPTQDNCISTKALPETTFTGLPGSRVCTTSSRDTRQGVAIGRTRCARR